VCVCVCVRARLSHGGTVWYSTRGRPLRCHRRQNGGCLVTRRRTDRQTNVCHWLQDHTHIVAVRIAHTVPVGRLRHYLSQLHDLQRTPPPVILLGSHDDV